MSFTVKQVRERFPEVQFCGGKAVLHFEGKNTELGYVSADGVFIPSEKGKEMLQSGDVKEPSAAGRVKPKAKDKVQKVEEQGKQEPVENEFQVGLE